MGGSYKQCSLCGKRALSIATRCPGCGSEEWVPPVQEESGTRRPGGLLLVVGVVAVLAVAAIVALLRVGGPEPVAEEEAEVASSMATTHAAATPAEPPGERLVARTWTNVRSGRSVKAPLEAMLLPADTVTADSLERGWYRVALEGEVLGYVHRSTLTRPDTSP